MKFNINDHVRVRLTDRGRALHRQHHDELFAGSAYKPDYRAPEEDAAGWSRWQLWKLMHEFGDAMTLGSFPPPFETEIEVESAQRQTKSGMRICDCAEHPYQPERCCPTRGHFGCGGDYRMPPLPKGMLCARKLQALLREHAVGYPEEVD